MSHMSNTDSQITPEEWLAGNPYLVGGDEASLTRFSTVYDRSIATRARAEAVASEIKAQAQEILEPFGKALRTDLVAESNRMEGYEWSRAQVREVVEVHRELIRSPLHNFMEAMLIGNDDPRLPSIYTAAPVGPHPPLRAFGAAGKAERQYYLLRRGVFAHTWPTTSTAKQLRENLSKI